MKKYKHEYIRREIDPNDPYQRSTISFRMEINGQGYGDYVVYNKYNLCNQLKNLLRLKHAIIWHVENNKCNIQ